MCYLLIYDFNAIIEAPVKMNTNVQLHFACKRTNMSVVINNVVNNNR